MIHGKPPEAEARSNARFARGADEGVRPYTNRGAPDALVRGECSLVRVSNVVAEASADCHSVHFFLTFFSTAAASDSL